MLRGLATISLWADEVEAARVWYSDVLGIMDNPHYLEILAAKGSA